jgi:P27 family predicted phage terminase small subunit
MNVKKIPSPENLSKEARSWWNKITTEYGISDQGGLLILQTALEAFDRMRDAQKTLVAEGLIVQDRFMQQKAHPLCTVERDARSQFMQGLRHLNLDVEPLKSIGRPTKG